ncbi:hypothetical protein LTR10_012175 [Elasticomyces elasticus]|nr:hypothetical protein LTR10_012175 [Elasticomyces elasticus]KAK4969116.1 hypothetical protein LTR42_009395 [Elasticomyces elasticus]
MRTVPSASSQPLASPLRTTSREPSRADSSRGQDVVGSATGQTLGAPDQQDASTGLSGATASDPAESIGRGSKRSLTGRRRNGSTASKRSVPANEKAPRPESAGRLQPASQPTARPKKKRGLMAMLCCSSSEETDDVETAQAPKPVSATQSSRVQQTAQSPQQANTSVPNTSAEESKEIINEKAVPPSDPPVTAILPPHESEKAPQLLDPTMEQQKPMPALPVEEQTAQSNSEPHSPENMRQQVDPNVGPAHIDSSSDPSTLSPGAVPPVVVQPSTPLLSQSKEDEIIADQTPKQRAQDEDIEMQDANAHLPHVPLTVNEAAAIAAGTVVAGAGAAAAVEGKRLDRDGGGDASREVPSPMALPPPPGPPPTQSEQPQAEAQKEYDGTVVSQQEAAPIDDGRKWLLGPLRPEFKGKKCLVLDLDETLVHSSFKILHQADFTIPVEIEGQYHNVYVIKRPGVDAFMKRVGELYEVVVFTASVSKYGDPLLDQLDIHHVVHHRLFRESCYNHQGNYVKDLSMMGRDLRETIIIDNSPTSYIFHPQHAVPISSWFSDAHDNELLDLIPVLEDLAGPQVSDVSLVLDVAL